MGNAEDFETLPKLIAAAMAAARVAFSQSDYKSRLVKSKPVKTVRQEMDDTNNQSSAAGPDQEVIGKSK